MHESTIEIKNVQIQPACHQTKRRNILNWLTMRTIFYAQMRNIQSMKKQQKRGNTGSIFLILEIIIIIIIILINL